MTLPDNLSLRIDTACRWANSHSPEWQRVPPGSLLLRKSRKPPDAKVSCPSGCWRIIVISLPSAVLFQPVRKIFKLCQGGKLLWIHELRGMACTLPRYVNAPRFLTNSNHKKINCVNLFMRLNEFSSVRHIYIARACREGYLPCLSKE